MKNIKYFLAILLVSFSYFFGVITKIKAVELSFSNPTTYHLSIVNNYPNWTEAGKFQPVIFFENSIFKMWYGSFNGTNIKLAYATSSNGIEWQGYSLLSLPSDFNNRNTHNPAILKVNNQYHLFFSSSSYNWDDYKIYKITSTDGINFNSNTLKTIFTTSSDWDRSNVSDPFVFLKNNTYYLFYNGVGNGTWQIGMAVSSDGDNWTRCSNNPIIPSSDPLGGPALLEKEGKFYLFFHSSSGVEVMESLDSISCNTNWTNRKVILPRGTTPFDTNHMISPKLLERDNQLYLFYSGLANGIWSANLAIYNQLTPTPKIPLILLPGFMGSWNKEAILHNQQVGIFDWKLAPYIREFDGIINTLKNLGLVENQDFLVFPYDWRKSLDDAASDFNNFLQQKIWNNQPQAKINIVGHSLGGLVGRIWSQKYNQDKVNKLITVGSPHQGTAQVYKAVEGGELDYWNNFLWLAEKTILTLNKNSLETDAQTINKLLPVLKDILPTYDFLKKESNEFLSINNMQIKNNSLLSYNSNQQIIYPHLTTHVGDRGDTLSGFNLGERTVLDRLLNLYPDGRPVSNLSNRGDLLILSQSAGTGNNIKTLPLDHGEILYAKGAIKEILNSLAIPYQENQIAEGRATVISPSLLFFLKSPAQMEVSFNNNVYAEQDGLIFIENAQSGNYNLKVLGKEKGKYSVLIGQIGSQTDQWSKIEGEITQTPPTSQIDTYPVNFNLQSPQSPLSSQSSFDELIYSLFDLNKLTNIPQINYSINNLKLAKSLYQNNQKKKLKSLLLLTHSYLITGKRKITDINYKNKVSNSLEKLENLYHIVFNGYTEGLNSSRINQTLTVYKQRTISAESYLQTQKNNGKNIFTNTLALQTIYGKLKFAENHIGQNNYNFSEILLKTAGDSLNEIKKL